MKILRIAIHNLNSLKGKHLIDFTAPPLVDHPLYAIVGPTGAGKTTILDAITLALYGQTERTKALTEAKKEVATVMTHGTAQCRAEVEFETSRGRFRSVWRRRRAHKKVDRDLMASERELSKWNERRGVYEILATRKREVDARVEEVTGLTYDRFVRSVMLTQGDFDRFLKSETGEKAAILEQITGTEIYRQLSEGAFQRHKLAREAYERMVDAMEHVVPLTTDARTALEDEIQQQEATGATLRATLAHLNVQREAYQQLHRAEQQRAQAENRRTVSTEEWQALAPDRERLRRSDALSGIGADLLQEQRVQEEIRQLAEQRTSVEGEERALSQQLQQARGEREAAQHALAAYDSGATHRDQLLGQATDLEAAVGRLTETVARSARELSLHLRSRQSLQEELERLEAAVQALDRQVGGLSAAAIEEEQAALEEELPRLEERLGRLVAQQEGLRLQERIRQEASRLQERAAGVQQLTAQADVLIEQLATAETAVDLAKERKESATLRANLEELRQQLQGDAPCPLCGATHHPYLHGALPVEGKLSQLKRIIHEADNRRLAVDNELRDITQRKKALEAEISGSQRVLAEWREQLRPLDDALPTTSAKVTTHIATVTERTAVAKKRLGELRRLRPLLPQLSSKRAACQAKQEQLQESDRRGRGMEATLGQEKDRLREVQQTLRDLTANTAVAELRHRYREAERQVTERLRAAEQREQEYRTKAATLTERRQLVEERQGEQQQMLRTLREALAAPLSALGYGDATAARAHLLDQGTLTALRQRVQRSDQARQTAEALLRQATTARETARAAVDGLEPEQEVAVRQQAADANLTDLTRHLGGLTERLRADDQRLEQVAELRQQLEHLEKERDRWARLNELIGSADGKKFRSFAQSITLQRLVNMGNRHLETINPRYRMSYAPPPPGGKELLDLEIVDTYMNDNRRTMETLSGGERFLISLALALGLSDLASGQQLIQSLFIDEGFGTLDGKTLDQAMATLEQLQAQGKTIGIISHVQQLRERVHCQIQLEPVGDGFSRVQLAS